MLFLADKTVAPWISNSFPILRIVMLILMVILSIALIVCVMMQPSAQEGMGAIAGQDTKSHDSFYGKNKGKTVAGTLKIITIAVAISLVVLCVLFCVSLIVYKAGM